MRSEIRLYSYNIESIKGKNELCKCGCNIKVIDHLQQITTKPSFFIDEEISAYCPECSQLYYIHKKNNPNYHYDDSEIVSIEKINYDNSRERFKKQLETLTDDNTRCMLNVDDITIEVLSIVNTDKIYKKCIHYFVNQNDFNFRNNEKCNK